MVRAFQGVVRIDLVEAGCVDQAEEQVAEFSFHLVCIHFVYFCFQFGKFFVDFVPNLVALFPVEAYVARLILDAMGFNDRGQRSRDAFEYGFVTAFFL